MHALQRKLNASGFTKSKLNGVGVISHTCDLQTHKGDGDYVHSIIGTGNPLDKTGARSAFIEEARCHLDISLVIEYSGIEKDDETLVKAGKDSEGNTIHYKLEEEIARNDWLTVPFNRAILFDTPVEQRWQATAALIGIDINQLSGQVGHA